MKNFQKRLPRILLGVMLVFLVLVDMRYLGQFLNNLKQSGARLEHIYDSAMNTSLSAQR
jgi:hypothetical protein